MKVKFNYQQNRQSTLIEHKKKIEKKENMSLGILAFFTNIFRDEAKVLEIIFCHW